MSKDSLEKSPCEANSAGVDYDNICTQCGESLRRNLTTFLAPNRAEMCGLIQACRKKLASLGIAKVTESSSFVVDRVLRLRRNTHWHFHASLDSLLSRAGLWHLGKGWIVTFLLPYWANWLFYANWNRLYRFTVYRQQCCRLLSTDLT